MKSSLGVSAFGLKECVAQAGKECYELGFYPTSAVLPTNPFGRILTGDEAYKERIHVGLPWPPEARIQIGEPVRRCPVSIVWRALVEAGDRMIRWNAGQCGSFSLARILATHIKGLLTNTPLAPVLTKTTNSESSALAVAIPDHLDEFGQEILLRELAALGLRQALLVWRPVAAALSWLDKVEGDFPVRMNENDHIHLIYLGPDALEFTTFRLRVKEHNNQYYVLPLRDRPNIILPMTGVDWAGRLIEELFTEIDEGAFWQALIQFPEIWQTLAGRPWNFNHLPRPWNRKSHWRLWNPGPEICGYIYDSKVIPCSTLRQILEKSCLLNYPNKNKSPSMGEFFRSEVQRLGHLYPGGRLRGMIVCGPLAPSQIPSWLSSNLELLASRGLDHEGNLQLPEAGRLWLSANCDDPIAEGAAIYGQRILNGIPSYLDTMPQLSILAREKNKYTWVPLLNAQEVWGGEWHKDKIEGRFQLDAGKRNLHIYLYRGPVDDAPTDTPDPFEPHAIPLDGVSKCKARLIREVVRRIGSLEAVKSKKFFQEPTKDAIYGLSFANALFTLKDTDINIAEAATLQMIRTPLRRAAIDFPSSPASDTVLDIEVRIRPASGLARIEILPKDNSFLQGERVRLNYSTMKEASTLPKRMRGWPRIEEIIVDQKDAVLHNKKNIIENFEKTLPISDKYSWIIDEVRDKVIKGTTPQIIAGLQLYLRAVDQNGQACTSEGNEILQRIASKFESDFILLQKKQYRKLLNMVFSRAAWLYASTPPHIVSYIRAILKTGYKARGWNTAVDAASRAFVSIEDFRLLFQSISLRAKSDPLDEKAFPNNAARAICNVLMLRKKGEMGLEPDIARLFANLGLRRLLIEQHKGKFKTTYFQMIQLLLYLLRFRKSDPSCFDPNISKSIAVFQKAKESMSIAMSSFPKKSSKAEKIKKVITGFDKFLHYEGTEVGIPELIDLAENDS